MLSPHSQGLFRRAISQGGVALSPWALQKNPMALAKKVRSSCWSPEVPGCSGTSSLTSGLLMCADRSEGWLLEER